MSDREDLQSWAWSMLKGRAQQYERIPGSFRGLKAEDIAAMLADLPDHVYMTGKLCEASDWSCLPRVASHLYFAALDLSEAEEWDLPRGVGQLRMLVYLSLIEATGPSVMCSACKGTGQDFDLAGRMRSCEPCKGRGRLPVLQKTRANIVGVNESNWRRTWQDRYHRVDQILQSWLQDARDCLADGLAGRSRRSVRRGRMEVA